MELSLVRRYFPEGTNGNLWNGDHLVCHTIELPWKDNERNVSCIPEGRYLIQTRHTEERGLHYMLAQVPNRSFILFHPANNALKELKGCIAPVSRLTGPGKGLESRRANENFKFVLHTAMEKGEGVYLTIKSIEHANHQV
ncbi:MAG: DUF5675 family protein [Pseudomonadales bacterium]|uniref:DUF5675 family protein n=1 Tax=Ekhidna sp. TaxID=2608089 RepID=UPI0032EE2BEC